MADRHTVSPVHVAESSQGDRSRRVARYHARPPGVAVVPASWYFVAALVVIGVSFVAPQPSVFLGAAIAAWTVWQARAEFLPTVIVLQFSSANFMVGGIGSSAAFAVSIAGFPVSVAHVISTTLTARVVFEMFSQSTFRTHRLSWLVWLWLGTIPFALVMAFMGRAEDNPSWMGPVRTLLMAGAFFYGIILKRTWPEDGRLLQRWLMPIVVVTFLLTGIGLFWHRFLFLCVSLGVPLGVFGLKQRGTGVRMLGIACIVLTVDHGLGIGLFSRVGIGSMVQAAEDGPESAGGVLGGSSTFTLSFVMLVSLALSVIYFLPRFPWRGMVGHLLRWWAFPLVVLFSVTIAMLSPRFYSMGSARNMRVDPGSAPLSERISYKLFDDRSVIWYATLQDVIHPPYIFRPSGRPLIIEAKKGDEIFLHGSHNVVLETMKTLRWVAGPILLTMLAVAMAGCARTFYSSVPPSYGVLAIATLATATIGSITGHYPLTEEASFVFMGLAGLGWIAGGRSPEKRAVIRQTGGRRNLQPQAP